MGESMLLQKNLFNKKNKIDIAIERMQTFVPPEGYYLAFSGGKDSVVIETLAKMAEIKYESHYNMTTIDPPEVIKFIRQNHPNVAFDKPRKPFLKLLEEKGFPMRQHRWCCEELKECNGSGRTIITGIRWAESHQRANRRIIESCYKDSTKKYVNPIIDWTTHEVWEFIRMFKVSYCSLYNEGFDRIGCLMCPMASTKKRVRDSERYPKYTKAYIRSFEIRYDYLKSKNAESIKRWKSGEEMFWWWLKENKSNKKENEFQLHLMP